MFRRGTNRPFRRFAADIPPALQRANELMASGDYPGAAAAFEQAAQGAVARGGPRAPWLLIQAGRMRILAGQVPAGMAHLQQGLTLIATHGNWQRLFAAGGRVAGELKSRGLTGEAAQIEALVKEKLPTGFKPAAGAAGQPRPVLPTNCPGCGAPVRGDEADWIDTVTAECPYCGSPVRAES